MADTTFKANDTYDFIEVTAQALNTSTGLMEPIDLTNAVSARLIIKGTFTVPEATVTFYDRPNGVLRRDIASGDFNKPDTYEVELEITWPGGKIESIPNKKSANPTIEIDPELG